MSDTTVIAVVTAICVAIPAIISAVAGLVIAVRTRRDVLNNTTLTTANAGQTDKIKDTTDDIHTLVNGVKAKLEADLKLAHQRILDLQQQNILLLTSKTKEGV